MIHMTNAETNDNAATLGERGAHVAPAGNALNLSHEKAMFAEKMLQGFRVGL
jgi:hypothetical protein